jgi:hypothetical protein
MLMESLATVSIIHALRKMFQSIKEQALKVEKEYNEYLETHPNVLLDYKSYYKILSPILENKLQKIEGILNSYNNAIAMLESLGDIVPESEFLSTISLINLSPTTATKYLKEIISNCDFAIGLLEGLLISSKVSPEERDSLKMTKQKVEALYECDYLLADHLKEAIMEVEIGHDLAATLIAGKCFISIEKRLIKHLKLDKESGNKPFQEKKRKQREELIKEISKTLGLSADKTAKIHKASILARNFFTHRLDARPSHEEALSLLMDTVMFAEYFCKLIRSSEAT